MNRKTLFLALWGDIGRCAVYCIAVLIVCLAVDPSEAAAGTISTALICALYCKAQYIDRKREAIK